MTTKFQVLKVKRLLSQIDEYDLDVPAGFRELTLAYIVDNYNGAGPDWLPETERGIFSWLLSLFEPAFLIHDMEFAASNRTAKGFNNANDRMWSNIRRIINREYPLYNPLCWVDHARWYLRGTAAWRVCKRFGWYAWID